MSILIDDIQEELRREDLMQKLKKALPWMVAAVASVLVSVAGYTVWENMCEQNLIRYEAMYADAIHHIQQSDTAVKGEKALQKIAQECPALRFSAWMTLAAFHSNQAEGRTNDQGASVEARKQLLMDDTALLESYTDRHFREFLALSRFFLDADSGKQGYGPSAFGGDSAAVHASTDTSTGGAVVVKDLQPLKEKDRLNNLSLYQSSDIWEPLGMGLAILKAENNLDKQRLLKHWIPTYKAFLGGSGTLPQTILMGTVEDFNS